MVELSLADRPAIVTGASRGIGREIAARFAEAGGDVVVCSRTYGDVEAVATELTDAHDGRVVPVECDVTDRAAVQDLVDTTIEEFGDIRVLVNNAGGADESANVLHRCDEETFESMVGESPEVGLHVHAENGLHGDVVAVREDTVEVDFNHELAGRTLTFEIEVVDPPSV